MEKLTGKAERKNTGHLGTDPVFRARLEKAGLWREFYTYRDKLKKDGMRGVDARRLASVEFTSRLHEMGMLNADVEIPAGSYDRGVIDGAVRLQTEVFSGSVGAMKEMMSVEGVGGGDVPVVLPFVGMGKLRPVVVADFGDRVATEAENIRWVARHMEIRPETIEPGDCPSSIAWNLLAHCLDSRTAKSDFWKNTYPKLLPSRSQLEEVKNEGYDGQDMVDVIGQVMAIVDDVGEECDA